LAAVYVVIDLFVIGYGQELHHYQGKE